MSTLAEDRRRAIDQSHRGGGFRRGTPTCVMEQLIAVLRLVARDQPRELSHRAP